MEGSMDSQSMPSPGGKDIPVTEQPVWYPTTSQVKEQVLVVLDQFPNAGLRKVQFHVKCKFEDQGKNAAVSIQRIKKILRSLKTASQDENAGDRPNVNRTQASEGDLNNTRDPSRVNRAYSNGSAIAERSSVARFEMPETLPHQVETLRAGEGVIFSPATVKRISELDTPVSRKNILDEPRRHFVAVPSMQSLDEEDPYSIESVFDGRNDMVESSALEEQDEFQQETIAVAEFVLNEEAVVMDEELHEEDTAVVDHVLHEETVVADNQVQVVDEELHEETVGADNQVQVVDEELHGETILVDDEMHQETTLAEQRSTQHEDEDSNTDSVDQAVEASSAEHTTINESGEAHINEETTLNSPNSSNETECDATTYETDALAPGSHQPPSSDTPQIFSPNAAKVIASVDTPVSERNILEARTRSGLVPAEHEEPPFSPRTASIVESLDTPVSSKNIIDARTRQEAAAPRNAFTPVTAMRITELDTPVSASNILETTLRPRGEKPEEDDDESVGDNDSTAVFTPGTVRQISVLDTPVSEANILDEPRRPGLFSPAKKQEIACLDTPVDEKNIIHGKRRTSMEVRQMVFDEEASCSGDDSDDEDWCPVVAASKCEAAVEDEGSMVESTFVSVETHDKTQVVAVGCDEVVGETIHEDSLEAVWRETVLQHSSVDCLVGSLDTCAIELLLDDEMPELGVVAAAKSMWEALRTSGWMKKKE